MNIKLIGYILGLVAVSWLFYQMGANAKELACKKRLDVIAQSSDELKKSSEVKIHDLETRRITDENVANNHYRRLEASRVGKPAVTCIQSGGRIAAVIDPNYKRVLLSAIRDPRLAEATDTAIPTGAQDSAQ